jgi:hypothetical protein
MLLFEQDRTFSPALSIWDIGIESKGARRWNVIGDECFDEFDCMQKYIYIFFVFR